ncbi:hypothetical protein ACLKA6_010866 [Drosophila palustris]
MCRYVSVSWKNTYYKDVDFIRAYGHMQMVRVGATWGPLLSPLPLHNADSPSSGAIRFRFRLPCDIYGAHHTPYSLPNIGQLLALYSLFNQWLSAFHRDKGLETLSPAPSSSNGKLRACFCASASMSVSPSSFDELPVPCTCARHRGGAKNQALWPDANTRKWRHCQLVEMGLRLAMALGSSVNVTHSMCEEDEGDKKPHHLDE